MKLKKTGLPYEVYTAEERAATLEQELVALLDSGQFELRPFSGYLQRTSSKTSCGCSIGGLALAVANASGGLTTSAFRVVADTGLATKAELEDLEQGYEFGSNPPYRTHPNFRHNTEQGCFFEAGLRIRARRDAHPSWNRKSVEEQVASKA